MKTNQVAILCTLALLAVAAGCGDAASIEGNDFPSAGANNGTNNGTNNGPANNGQWDSGNNGNNGVNNGNNNGNNGGNNGAGEPGPNDRDEDGAVDPDTRPPEAWTDTTEDNLATFSIDVDTASYTAARRAIEVDGRLPNPEAVRVEEFLNFFDYDYEGPSPTAEEPFAIHLESAPSPFGADKQLVKIGIKGMEVPDDERPATNLVFLIDVSGSMTSGEKLPLVKYSLTTLLTALRPQDTLGIVVYAGRDAVLLEPTRVEDRGEIQRAIESLRAGGSTNGASGIRTAYELAQSVFIEGGINRVVLCTDGDFNVGVTGESLVQLVESWRDRDITLTVLGYGAGFNDNFLEELTNRANGNYAFIDSRNEALRVLGDKLISTLQVIAKDVKIQVELDADTVARYRLIGYTNRLIADEDFRDDTVDAGEIGSGHEVTALLELELREGISPGDAEGALGTVYVRHKKPDEDVAAEVARPIALRDMGLTLDDASDNFRFAASVAEFGEVLSQSTFAEDGDLALVMALAETAIGEDARADRLEFLEIVSRAHTLSGN